MGKKMTTKMKQMVGQLPENWAKMSPEDKIRIVKRKYKLFCEESGWNDFSIYFDDEAFFKLEAERGMDAESESWFVLDKPAAKGKFDFTKFPEYLQKLIRKKALENIGNDEADYNIVNPESESGTFAEAAESMYFLLDLLAYGYHLDMIDNYKAKYPEIYPDAEPSDHGFGDDED